MKKYLLFIFIVSIISVVGAESLPGFWGIPWESSMLEVESAMESKGYKVTFKNDNGAIFKNVTFANRSGDAIFLFKENRFSLGGFIFVPPKNQAYESYQSLKKDLVEKYGAPNSDTEQYVYPYSKGDGHTEFAITSNYLKINTGWRFDDNNVILLSMKATEKEKKVEINLAYYFGLAAEKAAQESKKSTLDDL